MFKAKLIDHDKYHSLKRKQLLLILGIGFLSGIMANILLKYIALWIFCLALIFLLMPILFLSEKRFAIRHTLLNNKIIKVDEDTISIQSNTGKLQEIYEIDALEKIVVHNPLLNVENSLKELGRILMGKTKTRYLIVQQNNQQQAFHFELDSYYKVNKLNQIIDSWVKKGCIINRG